MTLSHKPVLLAEDEEHIAKLILFKLRKEGFEAIWARNGEEAIEYLEDGSKTYGALILDVMMPVKDGWEVLQYLRSKSNPPKLPVLMLTAKGEQQVAAKASELGATEVLKKPFDPEELVNALRRVLLP